MLKIPGSIPIVIHPLFWLLASAIGWINTFNVPGTLVWIAIIFVSVLVHEYGHAITAALFGQRVQINLVAMGGLTERSGKRLKAWQDFIIILAGPMAGFALAFVAFTLKQSLPSSSLGSLGAYALNVAFYVNVFWTILNLVPIQPLDGGKLFSIILEALFGLRGVKAALFISMALSVLLGLFFFSIHSFFAGIILMMLAFESYRAWQESLSMTEQDQNTNLHTLFKQAKKNLEPGGDREAALFQFEQIRNQAGSGVLFIQATEQAAFLLAEKKDLQAAFNLLMPINSKIHTQALQLLHQVAFHLNRWQDTVALGTKLYQSYPNPHTALINALSLAKLREAQPAVGWLQCAIKEGLPNLKEVLQRPEFDHIRDNPSFQQLFNKE